MVQWRWQIKNIFLFNDPLGQTHSTASSKNYFQLKLFCFVWFWKVWTDCWHVWKKLSLSTVILGRPSGSKYLSFHSFKWKSDAIWLFERSFVLTDLHKKTINKAIYQSFFAKPLRGRFITKVMHEWLCKKKFCVMFKMTPAIWNFFLTLNRYYFVIARPSILALLLHCRIYNMV